MRYINDTTLVLFDDGNTRHATNPNADSRGQELVLNEKTMTATLVVNADLGNYSVGPGGRADAPQREPRLHVRVPGSAPTFGQTIEVLPDGTKTYVQQMTGF